jgi:O-antigen ligase
MAALAALALTAGLFVKFVQLERRGRSASVVYLVIATILVETAIYPDPNNVPDGIFHPALGSTSFRLQDLVIPAALAARLLVRGGGGRALSLPTALWTATLAWLGVAAVIGLYSGNSASLVFFEAKAIIYLGAFALTIGVPVEELLDRRRFDRLVFWTAGIAAVVTLTSQAHVFLSTKIPLLPLADTGDVGSDGASLYATVAVLALAVGMTREVRRLPLMLSAIPLLASVAAAGQRAAMLNVVAALAIVAAAAVVKRRFRTTPTELSLIVLGLVAVVLVPVIISAATTTKAAALPFENTISVALTSTGKKLSAESRVNQLSAVRSQIAEQPVFGWGLGKEYAFYDPGPGEFVRTNLTHNIVTDLLLRTGIFGLILFAASVVGTLAAGLGVWRSAEDDAVAAFALASTAAVAGLLSKGLVESIFEKYRLAALLGILVGFVLGAAGRVLGRAEAPARFGARAPALAFAGVPSTAVAVIGDTDAPDGHTPAVRDRHTPDTPAAARRGRLVQEDALRRRETALRAQSAQLDSRARAIQRDLEELEQQRSRWNAELDERLRELRAFSGIVQRIEELLGVDAADRTPPVVAPATASAGERELAEREARLQGMKTAVEKAAADVQQRRAELDAREARLAQREQELLGRVAAAPRPAPRTAPAPDPAAAPAPSSAPAPAATVAAPVAASASSFNVYDLERRVEAARAAHPDRVDEWQAYLEQLAAHADEQGGLPPQFDGIVFDVFGDLL